MWHIKEEKKKGQSDYEQNSIDIYGRFRDGNYRYNGLLFSEGFIY
jgi:hypothetical protein